MALGISGILTEEYAWRTGPDKESGTPGAQIDLLIVAVTELLICAK